MISRSHALAGIGYGSLALALVGLTAIGPVSGADAVDVPGSADLSLSRDLASLTAAVTDAATLTTEHDRAQLGAPQVEPMAELTIEHDTAHLCAAETDQAVIDEEHDSATLTWEAVS
jgi:hypothetical protein